MIDLQGTEYDYLQVPISRHYSLPVKNKQASSWEEDGAPAAACSLASVPKRVGAWQRKGRDLRGEDSRRRVDPIHALGQ